MDVLILLTIHCLDLLDQGFKSLIVMFVRMCTFVCACYMVRVLVCSLLCGSWTYSNEDLNTDFQRSFSQTHLTERRPNKMLETEQM